MTILVFAQSYLRYKHWLEEFRATGDRLTRTRYVMHPQDLQGWHPSDVQFVFLPEWTQGKNSEHVMHLLAQVDFLNALRESPIENEEESA